IFAHDEGAGEIDGERLVPILEIERLDGAVRRHRRRDIDENRELAEELAGLTHRLARLVRRGDVTARPGGAAAALLDVGDGHRRSIGSDVRHHDGGTLGGEAARDGTAY